MSYLLYVHNMFSPSTTFIVNEEKIEQVPITTSETTEAELQLLEFAYNKDIDLIKIHAVNNITDKITMGIKTLEETKYSKSKIRVEGV